MARQTQTAKKKAAPPTEYVVLRREQPPEGVAPADRPWQVHVNQNAEQGADGEPRRVSTTGGRAGAIKAVREEIRAVGQDPHGEFKAVAWSSWKGSESYHSQVQEVRAVNPNG